MRATHATGGQRFCFVRVSLQQEHVAESTYGICIFLHALEYSECVGMHCNTTLQEYQPRSTPAAHRSHLYLFFPLPFALPFAAPFPPLPRALFCAARARRAFRLRHAKKRSLGSYGLTFNARSLCSAVRPMS